MTGGEYAEPPPLLERRLLCILGIAILWSVSALGCFSGEVGGACSGEFDCPHGTRCLNLGDGSGVCTVRCDRDPCAQGECVETQYGKTCTKLCESSADCSGDLSCQQDPTSSINVCWGADRYLSAAGAGVVVDSANVVYDTNADGRISPGEEVAVELTAKNLSRETVGIGAASVVPSATAITLMDVRMNPKCASGYAIVDGCDGQAGACSCSFQTVARLDPGDVTSGTILSFAFRLRDDADVSTLPFDVSFQTPAGDAAGDDSFELEVVHSQTRMEVDSTSVEYETNSDGRISPGEEAVVDMFARNTGATKVSDVRARVTSLTDGVSVVDPQPGGWHPCSSGYAIMSDCSYSDEYCECTTQSDFDPGEKTSASLLRFGIKVAGDVPTGEANFEATFEDATTGTSSSDTFSVEIQE